VIQRLVSELGIHRAKLPGRLAQPASVRLNERTARAAAAPATGVTRPARPAAGAADARRRYLVHVAVLALIRAKRRLQDLSTDAYVLSYPKCGRTWLRLMLGRVLQRHFELAEVPLLEVERFGRYCGDIPRLQFTHDNDPCIRHHSRLQENKGRYRHKPVVLLVREPKDTAVSMYFQFLKRDRIIDRTLSQFMLGERGGIKSVVEFYNMWGRQLDNGMNILLVRYEDMYADTLTELRRVVDFIGLQAIPDETLAEAVAYASFDRMQYMERADVLHSFRMTPGDPTDPESYKIRKGRVGGHTDYLEPADIAAADRWITDHLAPVFGYGQR